MIYLFVFFWFDIKQQLYNTTFIHTIGFVIAIFDEAIYSFNVWYFFLYFCCNMNVIHFLMTKTLFFNSGSLSLYFNQNRYFIMYTFKSFSINNFSFVYNNQPKLSCSFTGSSFIRSSYLIMFCLD